MYDKTDIPHTGRSRTHPFQEAKMSEKLLTPGEVAELFKVNPKTVTRWARAGKITAIRTLGGHRRFDAEEIRSLLDSAYAAA
jgi:excisionase family DNA binding protein